MYTDKDIRNSWNAMTNRCAEGYADICDEWKDYANFKEWFLKNVYATKQFRLEVDKDLFSKGKKLYSPETCCLLPKSLNIQLSTCSSKNGLLPGVTYNSKPGTFKARVCRSGIVKERTFPTEEQAFQFYKKEKEENIRIAADAYQFLLPDRTYQALLKIKVKPIRGKWQSGYQRKFNTYNNEM